LLGILVVGSADTDTDTQKVQSKVTSYILSANQLYHEYDSNEVAADVKYKGKVVIVSGTVQDIGKDIMGDAYIVIGGEGFLDGVQCMFTKGEQSSVSRLSKGQQVKVKGEVSGKTGNVIVNKCSLQ
jgi:tRNA(Ile2) C34 agmatinyltransferase TiaS